MVFLLITVVGVAYVGGKYAQIDKLLFDDDYTVSASFAESGGIFTGAEVTYRGQPVGRVGELKLLSDGVEVNLDIDKGVKIPNDLLAVVANRSAIGEQYVDLQPRRDDGPYLQDHSKIARAGHRDPDRHHRAAAEPRPAGELGRQGEPADHGPRARRPR